MEREGGGGIGMGNTCKLMAVSFQCMIKSTTIKKKEKKKKLNHSPVLIIHTCALNSYPCVVHRNLRQGIQVTLGWQCCPGMDKQMQILCEPGINPAEQ